MTRSNSSSSAFSAGGAVLYLGWQREAVEALRSLGAEVTCVVSPTERQKPAEQEFAGRVAVAADHTDVEAVLGALAEHDRAPTDFWTVCTEDEFALVPAAVLSNLGATRPIPVDTALALRDKAVQKRSVRAAGLPVADWVRCADLDAVRDVPFAPPFVVKPPTGAGSQHTWIVRDVATDLARVERSPGAAAGPWLVETFVPGQELHVDGVVRDGRPLLVSVSRYLHNVIDVHHGRLVASATLDESDADLVAAASALTDRALAALAHTDGVFHLEAFLDQGKLTFGECAGRIGGGMILEAVRAKYGVDLYDEWAAAVLGLPSPTATRPPEPAVKDSFGWVNLPARPGRIRSLPAGETIERQPDVVAAQLWAKAGEVVGDQRLGSHLLVAKALVRAPSEAVARQRLTGVADWFGREIELDALPGEAS